MTPEQINYWQMVFAGVSSLVSIVTVYLAYKIGIRQNEINLRAFALQDFAEIFFMPQAQILKDANGNEILHHWKILMKNASAFPIYINNYIFNNSITQVGGSPVPTDSDNWYEIPIPTTIDMFILEVEFQDHNGRNYRSIAHGKFDGSSWSINSTKRKVVTN